MEKAAPDQGGLGLHVLSQLNSHRGPEPEGSARRTSQAEGRDKNDQAWSYGALFCQTEVDLHNKDWGLDKYLEDLFLTKQVLRQHILLEVASILGERDAALKSIARRVRVALPQLTPSPSPWPSAAADRHQPS